MSGPTQELGSGLTPDQNRAIDFAYYSFHQIAERVDLSPNELSVYELVGTTNAFIAIESLRSAVEALPILTAALKAPNLDSRLDAACRRICDLVNSFDDSYHTDPNASGSKASITYETALFEFGNLSRAYLDSDVRTARQKLVAFAESVGQVMQELNNGVAAKFASEGSPPIATLFDQQYSHKGGSVRIQFEQGDMVAIQANVGRIALKVGRAGTVLMVALDPSEGAQPRPALLGDIVTMINLAGTVADVDFNGFDLAVHTNQQLAEVKSGRSATPAQRTDILAELALIYSSQNEKMPDLPFSRPCRFKIALTDSKLAVYNLNSDDSEFRFASQLQILNLDKEGAVVHRGPSWEELKAIAKILSRYDTLELFCCDIALRGEKGRS